jgi:predicted RNase H-like nuclease
VFPAPTRPALGHDDHAKASEANRDEIGKGLSIQTYNILEGIETVDEFLQNNPEARENVREAHPEVCFRALAGEALEHSKTTASGYAERLSALETVQKNVATEVHRLAATVPDADIGVDDLLDAVALAFSAQVGMDSLHTLPPQPATDTVGLPMEMVYRAPEPLVE